MQCLFWHGSLHECFLASGGLDHADIATCIRYVIYSHVMDSLFSFNLVKEKVQLNGESNSNIFSHYSKFLRMKYHTEIPSFCFQWPPPPTRKVFNLAMIEQRVFQYGPNEEIVRLLLKGDVTKVMSSTSEVTLKQISASLHTNGEARNVIIIEGAPCAGKSILAWHFCQKWKAYELFEKLKIKKLYHKIS